MPATNHIARERVKKYQKRELFSSKYHFRVRPQCMSRLCQYYFSVFRTLFGELWIHHKRYSTIISKITFFRFKRSKDFPTNRPDCENEIYPEAKSISLVFIENSKHRIQFRKTNKNHTHTHTLKREKEISKNKHVNS